MTDILSRLRNPWPDYLSAESKRAVALEAADTIEALRAELAQAKADAERWQGHVGWLEKQHCRSLDVIAHAKAAPGHFPGY